MYWEKTNIWWWLYLWDCIDKYSNETVSALGPTLVETLAGMWSDPWYRPHGNETMTVWAYLWDIHISRLHPFHVSLTDYIQQYKGWNLKWLKNQPAFMVHGNGTPPISVAEYLSWYLYLVLLLYLELSGTVRAKCFCSLLNTRLLCIYWLKKNASENEY